MQGYNSGTDDGSGIAGGSNSTRDRLQAECGEAGAESLLCQSFRCGDPMKKSFAVVVAFIPLLVCVWLFRSSGSVDRTPVQRVDSSLQRKQLTVTGGQHLQVVHGDVRVQGSERQAAAAEDWGRSLHIPVRAAAMEALSRPLVEVTSEDQIAFEAFDGWVDAYRKAEPSRKSALLKEGSTLAQQRRVVMHRLIQENPEAALRRAVPLQLLDELPAEIKGDMEEHVAGVGFYSVVALCTHTAEEVAEKDHSVWEHEFHRSVFVNNQDYRAHVYGARSHAETGEGPLYGIAIGMDMALAESSSYVAAQTDGRWLAAVDGEVHTFDTEEEARKHESLLLAALDIQPGEIFDPFSPPTGEAPPTEVYDEYTGPFRHQKGPKTVMFIYGNVSDYTEHADVRRRSYSELLDQLESSSQRYYDASYRQTWFGPKEKANGDIIPMLEVPPTVNLPQTKAYYTENGTSSFSRLRRDSQAAVRALGGEYNGGRLDPSNFDRIVFWSADKLISSTGLAYVGGRFSWSGNGLSGGVVLHELGHNWGLHHPGVILAGGSDAGVPRHLDNTVTTGGGIGSVMGRGINGLFSVKELEQLGFLDTSEGEVVEVQTSGTYRVFDYLDMESNNPTSHVRGLLIPINGFTDSHKHILFGFRHHDQSSEAESYEVWTRNALEAVAWASAADGSKNRSFQNLDTTPYSFSAEDFDDKGDMGDGAIPLGRTFSEPANLNGTHIYGGFHVTPYARGNITVDGHTHEYIDVAVQYGRDIGDNTKPEITALTASDTSVNIGESVNFSVTATDDDGDPLYYWWKFHGGDHHRSQDNAHTQSYSWDQAGEYWVSAVVSDGKGGLAVKGIRVTVGMPGERYEIRGRVLAGGQPIAGAKIRIASPGPDDEEKFIDTFSQSDGTYVLPNLSPGSYTIKATHQSYADAPSPSSYRVDIVSGSVFGRDFTLPVAPEQSYKVSGQVVYNNGDTLFPIEGAVVSLGGQETVTASDGSYTLYEVKSGDYQLTCTHERYDFHNQTVIVNQANVTNWLILARTTTMWVYVDDPATFGGQIMIDGYPGSRPLRFSDATRTWGNLLVPYERELTARILADGFTITPDNFTNPVVSRNIPSLLFTATNDGSNHTRFFGRVVTSNGVGIRGVSIGNGSVSTLTAADGSYLLLDDLSSNEVTLTASKAGYSFSPASRSLTVDDEVEVLADFVLSGGDDAPTVATAATATLAGVKNIHLNVLGADDTGEENLSYHWTSTTSAGAIGYLLNQSNDAKSTVATVEAAGDYQFMVSIRDSLGQEVSSSTAMVTVPDTLTTVLVSPGYSEVPLNQSFTFTTSGYNAFGESVTAIPTSWSVSGGGSIDGNGRFTADTVGDDFIVTATVGDVSATSVFSVIPAKPIVTITDFDPFVFSPGSFTLRAEASDSDGTVMKVEFFLEDTKVGEDDTAPFSVLVTDYGHGDYAYTAKAIDNDGLEVNTPPQTLRVSSPVAGIIRVNFEPEGYTTPVGFLPDNGDRLGLRSNGFHYGWAGDQTGKMQVWSGAYASEDASYFRRASRNHTHTWSMRVPNGRYTVQMRVGDGESGTNHSYTRRVNGIEVSGSAGAPGNEFITLSQEVNVTNNLISVNSPNQSSVLYGSSHVVIIPDIPVVAVSTSGDGDEHTPEPIEFTVDRLANPGESFTMDFRLEGSATSTDYTVGGATTYNSVTRRGSLDFGVGENSKVITVTPVQDSEVEGTETVEFVIEEADAYTASSATAIADILDAQTDYPPEIQLVWPAGGTSISLDPAHRHWVEVSATDDAFGGSGLTYDWTQVSGPGTVHFGDSNSAGTTIRVDAEGSYVIRATVQDASNSDSVDIRVEVGGVSAPSTGLLVHYAFDDPAGSATAADSSGNNHAGAVSPGVTFTPTTGQVGGSADFNGTSTAQILDDDGDLYLNGLGAITVSTWIKSDVTDTDRGWLNGISPVNGDPLQFRYDRAGFFGGTDETIQIQLDTSAGRVEYETAGNVQTTDWQHLVFIWESGELPKVYLDGVLDAASWIGLDRVENAAATGTTSGMDRLLVGRSAKDTSSGWDGRIDEVRIYNRALSENEVSALYSGSPSNTAPEVGATADATVAVGSNLNLEGTVSDAESTPTVRWRQLSGPGTATFADHSAEDTTVSFDVAGTYILALVGHDGEMAGGELLTVTVTSGGFVRNEDIPDAWEVNWFPGQDTPAAVTKAGREFNILTVYHWGVDPLNDEVLEVQGNSIASGFQIDVVTVSDRNYAVERCVDLSATPQVWVQIGSSLSGDGQTQSVTDPSPPASGVYRIRVWAVDP